MTRQEINKLENYFRSRFNVPAIEVRQRPQKDDSAEVYIGDEFIGVVFRDEQVLLVLERADNAWTLPGGCAGWSASPRPAGRTPPSPRRRR